MGPEGNPSIPELVSYLRDRVERVVIGQSQNIDLLLLALLCGGHILLEGVPGTAKTLLARTIARLLGVGSKRIQFTPDLMPSDILGTNVFNLQTSRFEFRPGPVFTDILIADEINRTPPKTQAALLEVMEEKTVTIDGISHPLSDLFTVVATQNPIEYEGTYRLPEAQLDRFLLKLEVTYPPPEEEDHILRLYQGRTGLGAPIDMVTPAAFGAMETTGTDGAGLGRARILQARQALTGVTAKSEVCAYIGQVVRRTREMDQVLMGASSRAAVHVLQASKVQALMNGRNFVIPDDVKQVCRPVLRHRVTLQPDAYVEGFTADDLLTAVLEKVEVPR
ncbi:MAG: MoxR family ATPase [Gemmataceae bacterium]|nr:MoxR family ATPase [Gemmataceae bacterium]